MTTDTIVAQATAPGRGGVGIVRVSGPAVEAVARALLPRLPAARHADYLPFLDGEGRVIDQGIALLFKAPHSFTGEDVLELQGHGGPVVLEMLIARILELPGLRLARPGEFSERAFLNDKLDLAQAEAIADLIEASSVQAARSAIHSLQGDFSRQVNALADALVTLRIHVEAAIDFPDEEIDFLGDGIIDGQLQQLRQQLAQLRSQAQQGALLRDGMKVVIAGRPNAGKSSLLNALVGHEAAIVTDIAGTTRDLLREQINIDGMPLHIIDTAGLRDASDAVEQIGIERAWNAISDADRVLLVVDSSSTPQLTPQVLWPDFVARLPPQLGITLVRNKADLSGEEPGLSSIDDMPVITISARQQLGLTELRSHLKQLMGYQGGGEGVFIARRRHLQALDNACDHLDRGDIQLNRYRAGELLAEELRLAHEQLGEITGRMSSDDLLGRIFGSFCIGK